MTLRALVAVLCVLASSFGGVAAAEVIVPPLPTTTIDDAAVAAAEDAHARAGAAYERGDLPGALVAATEAYEALPNASTALTRAVIAGELGRHREAFEAYLVARDLRPNEAELARIEDGLRRHGQAAKLGWVVIVVAPVGATVTIDGVSFEAPRIVGASAGRRRVMVEAPGREPFHGGFTVNAGIAQRLDYELAPVRPAVVQPPVERVEPPDRTAEWALIGSGAALLIGGAVFHFMAADAADETERWARPPTTSSADEVAAWQARHEAASDELNRNQTLAWTLYGVGAGLVIGGAILWAVDTPPEPGATDVIPMAGITADGPRVGAHLRF